MIKREEKEEVLIEFQQVRAIESTRDVQIDIEEFDCVHKRDILDKDGVFFMDGKVSDSIFLLIFIFQFFFLFDFALLVHHEIKRILKL